MSRRLLNTLTLFVCVAAAAAACGDPNAHGPNGPAGAPAAWRELTSEHFLIWTDTSQDRARELVRTMENLRQVVLGVSFFKQDAKGKSFVIAFDTLDEVHEFVAQRFIAQTWSGRNVLRQPTIVLAAASLDDNRFVVTHELTHAIAFDAIADQPTWFAEGIATYFETASLDESHGTVDVGKPLDFRLRELHDRGLLPASEVLACSAQACVDDHFYATVWALFTFLLEEHPQELVQYMGLLTSTPAADQAALWARVFPMLPPATLDQQLADWVHHGKTTVRHYKIALRDWPTVERPLTEADAWSAKAVLRFMFAPTAGAPPEVARALATDPTNVIANLIAGAGAQSLAPELVHAVTAAHPDDWRAWWLAWRFPVSGADMRDARAKLCTLLDANPAAVPIDECARDASGAFAENPTQRVFKAAMPQLSQCLVKLSTPAERLKDYRFDLDIADSGAVTSAHAAIGTPASNACAEAVMKQLVFPPHHAGPFRWLAAPHQ